VLAVDIQAGAVAAGDSISISTLNGSRVVRVRAVEFIDYDIGKPKSRSEVGLIIEDVPANEIIVGAEVCSVSSVL